MAKKRLATKVPARQSPDDRSMILDPFQWPKWPYLPVKRPSYASFPGTGLTDKNCWGILVATEELVKQHKPTIVHACIWDLPPTREEFLALPKTEYATVDAMLADGWVVD